MTEAFAPIERRKVYEQVSERLGAYIASTLAHGDALLSERELAERYRVGRSSVREALRMLESRGVIESRGFTVCDDLLHGFGGGYFPPVLGTRSRPAGPLPKMTLEENMTVVVQPNVIARDQPAGVQVGELIRVTRTGFERLHKAPRGFFRV